MTSLKKIPTHSVVCFLKFIMSLFYILSEKFIYKIKKMIYITALTEFSHNELENSEKIKIWNDVVSDFDIVYCLGDFATDPLNCANVLSELNGEIFVLDGSLDFDVFSHIEDISETLISPIETLGEFSVVLSHWCMLDWFNKDDGFCQIFGKPTKNKPQNSICASWDIWKRPMPLEDLLDFCKIENEK